MCVVQFTAFTYQQTVEPEREATFEYSFIPNEAFSSRAFGLTINLNYRDAVSSVQLLLVQFLVLVQFWFLRHIVVDMWIIVNTG